MPRSAIIAAAVLALLPAAAAAQDGERYRLERTENGFVRMDTQTGRMAFCAEQSGELACADAGGTAAADAGTVAELAARVEALERRLAALEGAASLGERSDLPSEEEFEQTMSMMERFMRRFFGIVKDLEGDTQRPEPERALPDRT